jgi:hypothetical protein
MARPYWCRYADCRERFLAVARVLLQVCPKCGRRGMWSSEPGNWIKAKPIVPKPPPPFVVTDNDYRYLLKRLRIARD